MLQAVFHQTKISHLLKRRDFLDWLRVQVAFSDFGGILLPTLAEGVISKTLGNAENEIEGAIEQRNGFGISLDIGLSVVISHAEGYLGIIAKGCFNAKATA